MLFYIWFVCTKEIDPGFNGNTLRHFSQVQNKHNGSIYTLNHQINHIHSCYMHLLAHSAFSKWLLKLENTSQITMFFAHRALLWSMGHRWSPLWGRRPWSEHRRSPNRQTSLLLSPWRCWREPPRLLTVVSNSSSGGKQTPKTRWDNLPSTTRFSKISVPSFLFLWSPM